MPRFGILAIVITLDRPSKATLAAACIWLLCGCGLQQAAGSTAPPGSGPVSPAPAPSLAATTTDNQHFDLGSKQGHPAVVDFFGSWCAPCRAEQPEMNQLAATYMPKGVSFVGVAVRDQTTDVQAYRQNLHVAYPAIVDGSDGIPADWAVQAPPETFVIDAHGQIIARYFGTLGGVSAVLDSALASSH